MEKKKELKFVLKLKEEPVTLIGADGVELHCILREANGTVKTDFLDDFQKRAVIIDGKITENLKETKGFQENLISNCLFDDKGKNISVETISKYPATVVEGLFEAAQEISGLNKAGEKRMKAEAKNDL